jgi:hypothetical protein
MIGEANIEYPTRNAEIWIKTQHVSPSTFIIPCSSVRYSLELYSPALEGDRQKKKISGFSRFTGLLFYIGKKLSHRL